MTTVMYEIVTAATCNARKRTCFIVQVGLVIGVEFLLTVFDASCLVMKTQILISSAGETIWRLVKRI